MFRRYDDASEGMADPKAVKRELTRLAAGDPVPAGLPESSESSPVCVIADGDSAVEELDRAVEFRDRGGLIRLRRAVETAEQDEDIDLTRRGQRVLAVYDRFSRAAESKRDEAV